MCVCVIRLNSMVIEKKKKQKTKQVVTMLAGCKHLCDRRCAQSRSADTGKHQLLTFQQSLDGHIIALNFYDTRLCHIVMDKCNDGCPQQKRKKKKSYDKMSKKTK